LRKMQKMIWGVEEITDFCKTAQSVLQKTIICLTIGIQKSNDKKLKISELF